MSIWHLVLSKVKRKDVLRLGSVRFLCSSPLWWRAGTRDLLYVIFIQLSCPWGVIWMEIYIQGPSCFLIPCPIVQLSKCPFDHFIIGKKSYSTCRWMLFIWKNHNDLIKMAVMNKMTIVCVLGDEKKKKIQSYYLVSTVLSPCYQSEAIISHLATILRSLCIFRVDSGI